MRTPDFPCGPFLMRLTSRVSGGVGYDDEGVTEAHAVEDRFNPRDTRLREALGCQKP